MQNQHLIANVVLTILNDAIFIKRNMRKRMSKSEQKIDAGGKHEASGDDKANVF